MREDAEVAMARSKGVGATAQRMLERLAPARFGGRMGLAVVALGLLVIGVGWNGAAGSGGEIDHVPMLQAQLPWLLSGGFLGLGIVILGAALVVVNAQREAQAKLQAGLDAVADALARIDAGRAVPDDLEGLVVAGTASYHSARCNLVQERRDSRLLTLDQALEEGLTPCRVCRPPVSAPAAP